MRACGRAPPAKTANADSEPTLTENRRSPVYAKVRFPNREVETLAQPRVETIDCEIAVCVEGALDVLASFLDTSNRLSFGARLR